MAAESTWIAKRAIGKSYNELRADPDLAPFVQNVSPLSGLIPNANWNARVRQRTLGSGAFGRVNAETIGPAGSKSRVATKYSLRPGLETELISEIATLRYLKGFPNVAQMIRVVDRSAVGEVPALLMGYAPHSLTDQSLYNSWDDILKTVIGVLQGYDTLHSLGIVHRDTKPGNMLMTAAKEVWITDFGSARYTGTLLPPMTGTLLPPCQDGYTGTRTHSSPEVLLKFLLYDRRRANVSHTNEGYRAQDAWGVGVSLAEILLRAPMFPFGAVPDYTETALLECVYRVKGDPVAADGETFAEKGRWERFFPGVGTRAQVPRAIQDRIVRDTVHKPSVDRSAELETVAQIIAGLLEYNPATRLTIRGALEALVAGGLLAPSERRTLGGPPLFNKYALSASISRRNVKILLEWFADVCEVKLSLVGRSTGKVVFDRACLYLLSILNKVTLATLQGYGTAALVVATHLFTESGYGMEMGVGSELTNYSSSEEQIARYVKHLLVEPTPFLGETFYDRMLMAAETANHKTRAAAINTLCFTESLYSDFVAVLDSDHMIAFLVSLMKSGTVITQEAIEAAFAAFREELAAAAAALRAEEERERKRVMNETRLLLGKNLSVLRPEGGTRSKRNRTRGGFKDRRRGRRGGSRRLR